MVSAQKVQINRYLSKKVYTETPRTGNTSKMKMRFEIEEQIGEKLDNYDAYDMIADLSKAFTAYLNIQKRELGENFLKDATADELKNIQKFLERQDQISSIINKIIEEKKELSIPVEQTN